MFASEVDLAHATWRLTQIDATIGKATAALAKAREPSTDLIAALDKARGERRSAQADLARARLRCFRAVTRCWKTLGLISAVRKSPELLDAEN